MRRCLVLLVVAAALIAAAGAAAHPLGNFTTNRYAEVRLAGDHAYVLYVLDLAEIPTFQARGEVEALGKRAYAARLAAGLGERLDLRLDGERARLRPVGRRLTFPPGVAGLRTTRLEVVYDAGSVGDRPVQVAYADENFAGRIGWREVVVRGTDGARVLSSTAPARSISNGLRAYPKGLLQSPLDVSTASARIEPGGGPGTPPSLGAIELAGPVRVAGESETGFAALVGRDHLGAGVLLVSLLLAMFWGAAHALTPGHGKAIVAAYLVGARGKARHALLLGAITTVTHTVGVFALGLVTLALSELVVPETLYPWLNLVSALLVVAVGVTVLRVRIGGWLRARRAPHARAHHDHHHHHDHRHGGHHAHQHSHHPEPGSGMRGLVAVGVSGGLLPCPTALVVLLAAISLHRVGYGLLLIVAFSLGLAAVISGIGLLAVGARRTFNRMRFDGPVVRALPAVSALVIVALGLAMTLRALPHVA